MRLGLFEHRPVAQGDQLAFALYSDSASAIPVPHPELFRAIRKGDTLSVDDGRILLRAEESGSHSLLTECLQGGMLRPRKGLNLIEHPVRLDDLTETDQHHIKIAIAYSAISFAISFMTDGHESDWVRRRAPGCRIVGKVERAEATEQIDAIASQVDALWICRGDLGAQLGPAAMAKWIAGYRPAESTPTLLAGQVLEHLTAHSTPTRSEVCHLYDVLLRGYAGIVLSDETAIGSDPVGAVKAASDLMRVLCA